METRANGNTRFLVSPAAEVTISYDPATGEEPWKVRHEGFGWNSACRMVYDLYRIDNGN